MMDRKPQKPNTVLYHFVYGIAYLFFKLVYRFKVDKTDAPDIKSPFVLLVNHISNLDFLLPMLAMYPFIQRFFSKGIMIGAIKE